jgi:hypothetical protein
VTIITPDQLAISLPGSLHIADSILDVAVCKRPTMLFYVLLPVLYSEEPA